MTNMLPGLPPIGRLLWGALGFGALGLGIAGIVLPLVPTTPFLLLAAFFFARCSARLETWLLTHRVFGRMIADWRRERAIRRRTKIVAIATMVALLAVGAWMGLDPVLLVVQASVLAIAGTYVATRREPGLGDDP